MQITKRDASLNYNIEKGKVVRSGGGRVARQFLRDLRSPSHPLLPSFPSRSFIGSASHWGASHPHTPQCFASRLRRTKGKSGSRGCSVVLWAKLCYFGNRCRSRCLPLLDNIRNNFTKSGSNLTPFWGVPVRTFRRPPPFGRLRAHRCFAPPSTLRVRVPLRTF